MNKPIYRSSSLVHYPVCPKKFKLSTEHKMERTEAMRNGLLFEGFLFGFKDDEAKKELIGRKKEATLKPMIEKAEHIKKVFEFDGKPFVKYVCELDEFILQGEVDFIGSYNWQGERRYGIVDCKFTNNIDKNWNQGYSMTRSRFFQSPMYCMLELINRHEGELPLKEEPLSFLYLVIENNEFSGENVLYRPIDVIVTREDLKWVMSKIKEIHEARMIGYPANDTDDNCIGIGAYQSHCQFMEWCEEGRNRVVLPNADPVYFSQLER